MTKLPHTPENVKPADNPRTHCYPEIQLNGTDENLNCLRFDPNSLEFVIDNIKQSAAEKGVEKGSKENGNPFIYLYNESPLNETFKIENDNLSNICISISFGEIQKTIYYPKVFIEKNQIPIIILPLSMMEDDINSKKYKYKIIINQKVIEILHHRLIIDDKNIIFIPIVLPNIYKYQKVDIVTYSDKLLNFNRKYYSISYPIANINNNRISFLPETLSVHRPYLNAMYLDAAVLYLITNYSLRKVCNLIRKKYKLNEGRFCYSTLSRYLKKILITDKKVNGKKVEESIKGSDNYNSLKSSNSYYNKKLFTKMKYISLLYSNNYMENYPKDIKNSEALISLNARVKKGLGEKDFVLSFNCNMIVSYSVQNPTEPVRDDRR
jgi:hypothetical protein